MNDFNVLSLMGTYYWENRVLYTIIFLIVSISPLLKYFYLPYKYGEVFTKIRGSSGNFIKYLKTLFVLILVLQGAFTLGPFLITRNSAYFTDFMIHRVYQYIYDNSIYNYNNLNVSELVIKIAKMNYFSNKFYYFIRELFTFSIIPLVTLTGYCYINLPPVFFKVMCVFSLLGMPPFLGFMTKLYWLFALIDQQYLYIVGLVVLMSVVGCYYYLRVMQAMFFYRDDSIADGLLLRVDSLCQGVLIVAGLAILGLGLYPGWLLGFTAQLLSWR